MNVDCKNNDQRLVDRGVPQGTVLGLSMLNIYSNRLFHVLSSSESFGFVKYIVFFYVRENWVHMKNQVEEDFANKRSSSIVSFYLSCTNC